MKADTAVKCGDIIRLEHVPSGRNVHSHDIRAQIAQGWEEVSSYGNDGNGDAGDNLRLICDAKRDGEVIYG